MQIPEKSLNKFIELYEKEYGTVLTREKASKIAAKLLILFKTIYKQK